MNFYWLNWGWTKVPKKGILLLLSLRGILKWEGDGFEVQ